MSDSRVRLDSAELHIVIVRVPGLIFLTDLSASSVSAVSPL